MLMIIKARAYSHNSHKVEILFINVEEEETKMKIAILFFSALLVWTKADALLCYTCINAKTNDECRINGKLQTCLENENACHNEVRRGSDGIRITKRCKQAHACTNNEIQNPKRAWEPTQCNINVPSSVCRCCCTFDRCNTGESCLPKIQPRTAAFDCQPLSSPTDGKMSCNFRRNANEVGSVCRFTCNKDYRRVGAGRSTCVMTKRREASFNNPVPRCVAIPKPCLSGNDLQHGTTTCSNGNNPGSVCSFECEQFFIDQSDEPGAEPVVVPSVHELIGANEVVCQPNGKWSAVFPICFGVTCSVLTPPDNVSMSCTYENSEGSICSFSCSKGSEIVGFHSTTCSHTFSGGVWTNPIPICKRIKCPAFPPIPENGNYVCSDEKYLDSECGFTCDAHHKLIGSETTRCLDEEGKRSWSHTTPNCERITCEPQTFLRNGRISCTDSNYTNSVCTYECTTDDFTLDPPNVTSAVCLDNSNWSVPKPCCSRVCPPYSVVDVVFAIDSSSSIGNGNFETIKSFVKGIMQRFVLGDDAARLGAFRYNRQIDTRSQILLGDYPYDRETLFRAFDRIPYNGRGTYTGQALVHAHDVFFNEANGDRPDVPNYLIIITDGKSFDSVTRGARLLREDNVHVYAIGVVPPKGSLDFDQLEELVSHEEDLIIATNGFSSLNTEIFDELIEIVCHPGCV